jgi:hypothetical protein
MANRGDSAAVILDEPEEFPISRPRSCREYGVTRFRNVASVGSFVRCPQQRQREPERLFKLSTRQNAPRVALRRQGRATDVNRVFGPYRAPRQCDPRAPTLRAE